MLNIPFSKYLPSWQPMPKSYRYHIGYVHMYHVIDENETLLQRYDAIDTTLTTNKPIDSIAAIEALKYDLLRKHWTTRDDDQVVIMGITPLKPEE